MTLTPEEGQQLHMFTLLEGRRISVGQAAKALGVTPRQVRRNGEPEDVAGVVLALASTHARFLAGCCVPVSGWRSNAMGGGAASRFPIPDSEAWESVVDARGSRGGCRAQG